MPEEVREWITVNGKHIPLDKDGEPITETGKKTLGKETGDNIKESGGIKYSKTLAEYKKEYGGDFYEAARIFFKNELQGKEITCRTVNGEKSARFTGGTLQELRRGLKSDPIKAEIIPLIPDIITTGKYRLEVLHKDRDDKTKTFHSYSKVVHTSNGDKEAIVDIAERPKQTPEYGVYNLTREGTGNYEIRAKYRHKVNASKADSGKSLREFEASNDSVVRDSIAHSLEIISIRFADDEEKEVIDDMARDKPRADRVAFDAKNTKRHKDSNGYLHVDASNITKEQVAPYYGSEIPNWQELGLEPGRLYYMYRPAEELKKAAERFFKEQLQGKSLMCDINGTEQEVHFTGGSWREIKRDMTHSPSKAEIVPQIQEILKTAKSTRREVYKKRKDDAVAFYEFRKVIRTSEGQKEAIVDVVEREYSQQKFSVYSITGEGVKGYRKRNGATDNNKKTPLSDPGQNPGPSGESNDSVVTDIVPHILEVASIRFADEEEKEVIDEEVREWITVNGKHIPLDKDGEPITETGKKTLGKETGKSGAQSRTKQQQGTTAKPETAQQTGDVVTKSDGLTYSKTLAQYREEFKNEPKGEIKAAQKFFREQLQGKSVICETRDGPQKVFFTSRSWQKLRFQLDKDPIKAELFPLIPDILTTGEYTPRSLHKERKDDIVFFHQYRKVMHTSKGNLDVFVDVTEHDNKNANLNAYNLTRQGTSNYKKRLEKSQKKTLQANNRVIIPKEPEAPNDSVVTDIIPHILEVASIRFADDEEKEVIGDMARDKPRADRVAFDAKDTKRRKDSNGYLHVDASNITKEQVAPYYGSEIPNWQELGLEPGRLYYMYRPAEELKKAAAAFNGMPVLFEHHTTNAENPAKEYVIGSLGTDAEFRAPYIVSSLIITDGEAIAAIERGDYKELSAAYMYTPVMQGGIFNCERYDGRKLSAPAFDRSSIFRETALSYILQYVGVGNFPRTSLGSEVENK